MMLFVAAAAAPAAAVDGPYSSFPTMIFATEKI
jgi:hypothetical protein